MDLSGRTITVGRKGRNDVVIRGDPFVSKNHCVITDGALRDTSKNGTRVNGSRVAQHSLNPGDCIRIGSAVLDVYGSQLTQSLTAPFTHSLSEGNMNIPRARSREKQAVRHLHEAREVATMLRLLKAFITSTRGSSRNCRTQDRFLGLKDEKSVANIKNLLGLKSVEACQKLRLNLLQGLRSERRNQMNFIRRTFRYLRRSDSSRRRLRAAWREMHQREGDYEETKENKKNKEV